jgi:hypothetical protein
MNFDQFISMNFEDALSIAALCSDLGISKDDTRLYIYIHAKSAGNPFGIRCFSEKKEEEILALEIMLGKKDFSAQSTENPVSDTFKGFLQKFGGLVNDSINNLDHIAREGCGREFPFRSELAQRLRFHTDDQFRKEKLQVFSAIILPQLKKYGKEKAYEVLGRQRKKPPVFILNFRDSLN